MEEEIIRTIEKYCIKNNITYNLLHSSNDIKLYLNTSLKYYDINELRIVIDDDQNLYTMNFYTEGTVAYPLAYKTVGIKTILRSEKLSELLNN
jgi:hypothetical protein